MGVINTLMNYDLAFFLGALCVLPLLFLSVIAVGSER